MGCRVLLILGFQFIIMSQWALLANTKFVIRTFIFFDNRRSRLLHSCNSLCSGTGWLCSLCNSGMCNWNVAVTWRIWDVLSLFYFTRLRLSTINLRCRWLPHLLGGGAVAAAGQTVSGGRRSRPAGRRVASMSLEPPQGVALRVTCESKGSSDVLTYFRYSESAVLFLKRPFRSCVSCHIF
jgi:hypothetical protein